MQIGQARRLRAAESPERLGRTARMIRRAFARPDFQDGLGPVELASSSAANSAG
jgi:hypothetical protein